MGEGEALPPGLRVLLVEDEALIVLDCEAMLKELGVSQVRTVRTLAEGLHVLETEKIDVALLDVLLGHDTSMPLARKLREAGVPFAFLTGYMGQSMPSEFKDFPLLEKPFSMQGIAGLLRSLLGSR